MGKYLYEEEVQRNLDEIERRYREMMMVSAIKWGALIGFWVSVAIFLWRSF